MPTLECVKSEKKNGVRKLTFFSKPQSNVQQSTSQSNSTPSPNSSQSSQSTPPMSPPKSLTVSTQTCKSSPKKQTQMLLSFASSQNEAQQIERSPRKLCLKRSTGPTMPICISGVLTILSLGTVEYERNQYHTYRYIYPIGYKSKRVYTSYINPKVTTTYINEILDGGDKPLFRVTAKDDPNSCFSADSPSGCCVQVVKRIDDVKTEKRTNVTVSGPSFFGFSEEKIRNLIYSLPNADKCEHYSHKRIKPPPGSGQSTRRPSSSKQARSSDGKQPPRKRMRFMVSGQFGGLVEEGYDDDDVITTTVVNTAAAKSIEPLDQEDATVWSKQEDDLTTIITIFQSQVPESQQYQCVSDVMTHDISSLGRFSAVLMDPPWDLITPQQLISLDMFKLTFREAYLFIWVAKRYIAEVLRLIERRWNFRYVENMCWIMEMPNHQYAMNESPYLKQSHQTMLIFKKEPKKSKNKMDIRHQRSPDVIFDFVQEPREKPRKIYGYLETLIPSVKFLELWGSRSTKCRTESRWQTVIQEHDK
jgi:N6-adenosine-specific RNA methylase IME4